jgi:hypothetical protein
MGLPTAGSGLPAARGSAGIGRLARMRLPAAGSGLTAAGAGVLGTGARVLAAAPILPGTIAAPVIAIVIVIARRASGLLGLGRVKGDDGQSQGRAHCP